MKCLSLWQPWASLVAIGAKRIETRGWSTSYRGPLAIHAAQKWTRAQAELVQSEPFYTALKPLRIQAPSEFSHTKNLTAVPLGVIIAVCTLVDCVVIRPGHERVAEPEQIFGDFRAGRFMWMLADVQQLQQPIPYPGRQSLFDVHIQVSVEGDTK